MPQGTRKIDMGNYIFDNMQNVPWRHSSYLNSSLSSRGSKLYIQLRFTRCTHRRFEIPFIYLKLIPTIPHNCACPILDICTLHIFPGTVVRRFVHAAAAGPEQSRNNDHGSFSSQLPNYCQICGIIQPDNVMRM